MNETGNPARAKTGSALLVIDLQQDLFKKSTPIFQADSLLENIGMLVDKAHQAGSLVIFVQHSAKNHLVKGSEGWRIHPQVQPAPGDLVIHKLHGNAFERTELSQELAAREVKTVIITGLVTHGCVKATCMGAKELGYEVVLVQDGHSNFHRQAAQIIEKTNLELDEAGVALAPAKDVQFQ